jgi:hypothetical protein
MSAMTGFESYNEICTVRIELLETEPLIWREVEVPTSVTLKVLHDVIQITVGWFDCHLWRFTIGRQSYGPLMPEVSLRLRRLLGTPSCGDQHSSGRS